MIGIFIAGLFVGAVVEFIVIVAMRKTYKATRKMTIAECEERRAECARAFARGRSYEQRYSSRLIMPE